MARFPQHEAKKGSQKWLQKLLNEKPTSKAKSMLQAQDKKDARDRLDGLFEVALVLLGILAAALLQYITANQFPTGLEAIQHTIWIFNLGLTTLPFIILIPAWMIKERMKIRGRHIWSMRLTFFCWVFWGVLLFAYIVNLFSLLGFLPLILSLLVSSVASVISVAAIISLYKETASDTEMILYFESGKWKLEIGFCVAFS